MSIRPLDPSPAVWPAVAGDAAAPPGVVVVRELFATGDVACRPDPDRIANHLRVAVRLALVVEESRYIAPDFGISHPATIDRKTPDVATRHLRRLTGMAVAGQDLLACVVDNARVLGNRLQREDAPPMEPGPASDNTGIRRSVHLL